MRLSRRSGVAAPELGVMCTQCRPLDAELLVKRYTTASLFAVCIPLFGGGCAAQAEVWGEPDASIPDLPAPTLTPTSTSGITGQVSISGFADLTALKVSRADWRRLVENHGTSYWLELSGWWSGKLGAGINFGLRLEESSADFLTYQVEGDSLHLIASRSVPCPSAPRGFDTVRPVGSMERLYELCEELLLIGARPFFDTDGILQGCHDGVVDSANCCPSCTSGFFLSTRGFGVAPERP